MPLGDPSSHQLLLQCRCWVCGRERSRRSRGLCCCPSSRALPPWNTISSCFQEALPSLFSLCLSGQAPSSPSTILLPPPAPYMLLFSRLFFLTLFSSFRPMSRSHLDPNFQLPPHDSQIYFFSSVLFFSSKLPTRHFFSTGFILPSKCAFSSCFWDIDEPYCCLSSYLIQKTEYYSRLLHLCHLSCLFCFHVGTKGKAQVLCATTYVL